MEATEISDGPEVREARAFLDGALRDELGLSNDDLQIGLSVAKQHMDRGAYHDALRIYSTLVLCAPSTIDFQVGLANCALQMEAHQLALQTASVVVALAPKDPRGYFLSGRACMALGLVDEARQDFNDAVEYGRLARSAMVVDAAKRLLNAMPALSGDTARSASA